MAITRWFTSKCTRDEKTKFGRYLIGKKESGPMGEGGGSKTSKTSNNWKHLRSVREYGCPNFRATSTLWNKSSSYCRHFLTNAPIVMKCLSVSRTLNALRLKSTSKCHNFTFNFAFQSTEQRNISFFCTCISMTNRSRYGWISLVHVG